MAGSGPGLPLPEGLLASVRWFDRVRLVAKARIARRAGWRLRTHGADWLRFVLLAPELEDRSYAIANGDELAAAIAAALKLPVARIRALLLEAEADPALRVQRRWLRPELRRHAPLGRRAAAYAVVRAVAPALVLEVGVGDGRGSLVLLAALRANGAGRLVSVDALPAAGGLVPAERRAGWEWVHGRSPRAIPGAVAGRSFDVLVTHTGDPAEHEHVLASATGPVVLLGLDDGAAAAVAETAAAHGTVAQLVRDVPVRHPGPGVTLAFARIVPQPSRSDS